MRLLQQPYFPAAAVRGERNVNQKVIVNGNFIFVYYNFNGSSPRGAQKGLDKESTKRYTKCTKTRRHILRYLGCRHIFPCNNSRWNDPRETARGAEGECENSQAKGSDRDDTSESALRGAYAKGATGRARTGKNGNLSGERRRRKDNRGVSFCLLIFCVIFKLLYSMLSTEREEHKQ